MKLIKKIHEGEMYSSAIIGYKILNFTDAKNLRISLYLKFIFIKIDIAIPNGKKPDTL